MTKQLPIVSWIVAVSILVPSALAATSKLVWENGDQLPGRLAGASETHIRWQSEAFETPFDIDLRVLKAILYPETPPRATPLPPLRFLIRTGEILYGSLVEINARDVIIDTPRHGRVAIRREALRSFDLVSSSAWTNVGPGSHQTWKTLRRGRSLQDWKSDGQGHLTTTVIGAELFGDLQLPEMSEIDIKLGFEKKPGFLITFLTPGSRAPSRGTVKLETWEDELVLQTLAANGGFESVMSLEEGTKTIQLRLIWDRDEGELSVFSQQGQLLGKMAAGGDTGKGHSGLYIKNKGSQLSLIHVQSSRSGGRPAELPRGSASYVRLIDGSISVGNIESYDAASKSLVMSVNGATVRVSLDKMSRAVFDDRMVKLSEDGVRIAFADGSMVVGKLDGVQDGKLRLRTQYSDQPVLTALSGARQIQFNSSSKFAPPSGERLAGAHMMQLPSGPLHGGLAAAGSDGTQLGWRPYGSRNASPLPASTSARIQLDTERAVTSFDELPSIDVIFLANGDIIPCTIERVDDENVYFSTELSDADRLPQSQVKALEFATRAFLPISGFNDSRWEFTVPNDKYEANDETITFKAPGTIGHQQILQGDEIRFDIHWNNDAPALTFIDLFTDGQRKASNRQLLIYFMQQQLFVRGVRNQFHQVNRQGRLQIADAKVSFRMLLTEEKLRVYADDELILDQAFPDSLRKGRGLSFTVQRINVARNRRPQKADDKQDERLLTISDFQIRRSSGPFGVRALDPTTREHLLTVPRNRKQNPDTHVIIGVNGDLLRGRLAAIDESGIRLKSRLDDLTIARDRVAGIVWLENEHEVTSPGPAGRSPVQAVLVTGTTLFFDAHRVRGNVLYGQHPQLGACQVPLNQLHELRMGTATRPAECVYADWKPMPAKEPEFVAAAADGQGGVEPFGAQSPLVGQPSPKLQMKMLDDTRFNLARQSGKVVVLDFWAMWCVPCVRAMPDLMEAVGQFDEDQVVLIGVNQQDNPLQVSEFLEARGWELKVGLDPDGRLAEQFGVDAIPQTVIIAPDGKVAHVHVGAHPQLKEALVGAIEKLLEN